mmetsp:Transcript_66033/g.157898  ORF Transcript_66033/g.157898 Transcript_66033/m.157898 type:complete len:134 (+) Transcript_66033:83-484(+)
MLHRLAFPPCCFARWLRAALCWALFVPAVSAPTVPKATATPKHPAQKPRVAIPHAHHGQEGATKKYHEYQDAIEELFAKGQPPPKRPAHHEHHERNKQHIAGQKKRKPQKLQRPASAQKGSQEQGRVELHDEL